MQFYRNSKERRSYMILNKNEWNRLRRHSSPPKKPSNEQEEYIQSLIEKSKAWTSTWPDHVRGHVACHAKKQQKQREADIAAVEAARKKRGQIHQNNAEAIKEARQKIFKESCYGKKLLSAFRESKALEERDVQVQFSKELKGREGLERQIKSEACCSFQLDKHCIDEEKYRKRAAVQMALENRATLKTQKEKATKAKEAQRQADLENMELMRKLLDLEEEAEKKVKLLEKEALDQYSSEHNKCKEKRAKWEAEYYAKIEKCCKEKEELNCKIKRVVEEMHKHRDDLPGAKKIYETIEQSQEEEKKRYNVFIENNNKLGEHRAGKRENKSKEKEKLAREQSLSVAETNKALAEDNRQKRGTNISKCFCNRQSVLVKSRKDALKKETVETDVKGNSITHFGPCNKLMFALKKRMEESSPWTGAQAAHDDFARHADDMLRDCKYKNTGRKVVDEYIKYNGLASLDVPNYY